MVIPTAEYSCRSYGTLSDKTRHSKGDVVGVLAPNDVALLDLLFACFKTGAVFLPINWRLNPKEIAAIVEDSTLKLLFYAEKHLSSLNEVNPKYLHMDIDSDAYNQIVDPHNILYLKLLT